MTILKDTIEYKGVAIDVYEWYSIHSGACQCYGDCDCNLKAGTRIDHPDKYRATELRQADKKLCNTPEAAYMSYSSTLNK